MQRGVSAVSDEANNRKSEHLEDKLRDLTEKRLDAIFTGIGEIKTTVTRIETTCISCQRRMDDHHVLLYGDPHAGTSGILQKIKNNEQQTEDVHLAVFGGENENNEYSLTQRVNTLHVRVEKLQSKVSLIWKGVAGAATAAGAALLGLVIKR